MQQAARITTIILTYRRDEALVATLGRLQRHVGDRVDHQLILIDNNADGRDRHGMMAAFPADRCLCFSMKTNKGVTGGRNMAIQWAEGEILVFLDDDSLLEGDLDLYDRLLARFDTDAELGAVAFRSWLRDKGVSDPTEFPHTDKSLSRDHEFETFRFIGAGHALRRSAVSKVGTYPETFFYGMEEFEMSLRLMKAGYRIVYDPSFSVTHMKSEGGRLVRKDVIERMYANKLFIAWKHLPLKEAVLCAGAWAMKTVLDSRDPLSVLRAFRAFTKNSRTENARRQPSRAVVNKIRQLGGAAWK
jgi:GT2 family glycosyltransferase